MGLANALTLLYFTPFFVLVFTHGDIALRRAGWLPLRPVMAFALFALPLVLYAVGREWPRGLGQTLTLYRQNAAILAPLGLLAALSLLLSVHPTAYWGSGGKFIGYPIYTLLVVATVMLFPLVGVIRRHIRALLLVALVMLLASSVADLLLPGLFAEQGARATGLPGKPNISAFLMLVACSLLLDHRRSGRANAALLGATGLGVLLTLSRAGALMFVLLLASYICYPLPARRRRLGPQLFSAGIGLASLTLAFVLAAYLTHEGFGMFGRHSVQRRVDMFTSGQFLSSSDARFVLAKEYFERISEAPVLGHGAAFAAGLPKGPHNRFLYEWVNLGVMGLAAYVAFLVGGLRLFLVRRYPPGVYLMLLVAVFSLFSHGLLESRGLLLALGLVATLSSPAEGALE